MDQLIFLGDEVMDVIFGSHFGMFLGWGMHLLCFLLWNGTGTVWNAHAGQAKTRQAGRNFSLCMPSTRREKTHKHMQTLPMYRWFSLFRQPFIERFSLQCFTTGENMWWPCAFAWPDSSVSLRVTSGGDAATTGGVSASWSRAPYRSYCWCQ